MADEAEPVVDDPTKAHLEVDADVVAARAEAGKTAEADEPKPGTPDKAMQRMQQELGNVTRQLAVLTEKKEAEGALSDADKAKLAKAQQRIEKIRSFVSRPDREDLPSEVDPVAEHVLELTEKVGKQDALEAQLKEANARLARLENDRSWQIARNKYAGLDVDAIWDKAVNDAGDVLADDATPRAVNKLASKWFEERCEAAKKRLKDDKEKPAANNKGTAPSTYRLGGDVKTAPVLSDEDQVMAEALSLVREI